MSNRVHPAPPDALSQIVNALAAVRPDDYGALKTRLLENVAALRTLKGAGFAPPDSEQEEPDAQLPPELTGFTILKDMPDVAAELAKPSFVAAQKAVQTSIDDENALSALQSEVMAVESAYKDAISARVQEDDIRVTCRRVIEAGNKDFKGVYGQVWQRIPHNDEEGLKAYESAVEELPVLEDSPRQTTKDPSILYQHAAAIKPVYASFVSSLVGDMPTQVSIPKNLKKMGRIIEKSLLKRKDDPGNADKVCDIVRGMITCGGMQQIADLIGRMAVRQDIVITRVKDRFIACPSAGGWRDCMINFYFKSDANNHICEIQLVHAQMLMARHGLPGHDVYNCVRNADEIVNQWMDKEKPSSKEEMLEWLAGWKRGDKVTHGPPGLWDVSKMNVPKEEWRDEFRKACQDGRLDVVKLLLRYRSSGCQSMDGIDIITPLNLACEKGHVDVVNALLSTDGIDINQSKSGGSTPLHIACLYGHLNVVNALLRIDGIDLNQSNVNRETPLYIACEEGYLDVVNALISMDGIDINQANISGMTPLAIAEEEENYEIVKLLKTKEGNS